MADEIKIPDFNLGDDFSEGGEAFQPKPPAANPEPGDAVKQKPKLLFEDEEEETKEPPKVKQEKPVEAEEESVSERRRKAKEAKMEEPKKPKKIWLWLIPVLILIIAGGSFFLQTQGYFDFGQIFTEAGKLKNKIFGGKDTLTAAIHDSAKSKPKVESPYENEFLRKPEKKAEEPNAENVKQENKKTEPEKKTEEPKKPEVKKEEKKPEIQKPAPTKEVSKSPATSKSSGKYSIQVSAWKLKSKAELEAKKIRSKGLDAKLVPVSLPNKGGIWYRVMVGSYSSAEEANKQLSSIKKATNAENCIVREN